MKALQFKMLRRAWPSKPPGPALQNENPHRLLTLRRATIEAGKSDAERYAEALCVFGNLDGELPLLSVDTTESPLYACIVYMYIHMYIHICRCTYVCMHACMHVYVRVTVRIRMHI